MQALNSDNPAFAAFGGTGFAHDIARGAANAGMIMPGTSEFDAALSRYTKKIFQWLLGVLVFLMIPKHTISN